MKRKNVDPEFSLSSLKTAKADAEAGADAAADAEANAGDKF